jgi:hypothetical protein
LSQISRNENFTNVFNDILKEYGYEKIVGLGRDLYGGCFISVKNEVVQITKVIVRSSGIQKTINVSNKSARPE